MSLETAKHKSGLTVYVDHMPAAHISKIHAVVPFGSVHERPGEEGAAHALEHCIFAGTPKFANDNDLTVYGQRKGTYVNAETDHTSTTCVTTGIEAAPGIELIAEVLQHARLPDEAVAHEMKAVRREAITALDDTEILHHIAQDYAMFGLPYGRAILGHHNRLQYDASELRAIYNRYYKLGSISLVAVGATTLDEIMTIADTYFDDTLSEPAEIAEPTMPARRPGYVSGLVRKESNNLLLSVGYPLSPELMASMQRNPLLYDVAINVISSSVFNELRTKRGISYDGSVTIDGYNHPNAWVLRSLVTTDTEHLTAAAAGIAKVLAMDGKRYHDHTLEAGIGSGKLGTLAKLNHVSHRMDTYTGMLNSGLQPTDASTSLQQVEELTINTIRGAIDDIVQNAATMPRFEHRTGTRRAIGKVEQLISLSEIA